MNWIIDPSRPIAATVATEKAVETVHQTVAGRGIWPFLRQRLPHIRHAKPEIRSPVYDNHTRRRSLRNQVKRREGLLAVLMAAG